MPALRMTLALLASAASSLAGQEPGERWVYPGGARPNPLSPPSELKTGEALPSIHVTAILFYAERPEASRAVVHVGGTAPERRVVRAGDRIGEIRIERVQPEGVSVSVPVLGTVRRLFVRHGVPAAVASSDLR